MTRLLATRKIVTLPEPTPRPMPTVDPEAIRQYAERLRLEEEQRKQFEMTRHLSIDSIISAACLVLTVTREELGAKSRHERVVLAREIITVLARKRTVLSFPEIARAFGKTNHSTTITAFQRHYELEDRYFKWWEITLTRGEWAKRVLEKAVRL